MDFFLEFWTCYFPLSRLFSFVVIVAQLHTFRVCDFQATINGYDCLIVVYDNTNCIVPRARGMIIQCPILSSTIVVLIVDSLPQV